MGVSGVPEVAGGVDIGFTDFSEFSVAAGLPAGITEFGIGVNSPDTVAIANDVDEGNYFSMDGHALSKGFAFGLDSFDGLIEFGEMLARVYFSNSAVNRQNLGPVFCLEGLTDTTMKFAGGSISRPSGDGVPQSDGKSEVTGTTFVSLNNNDIQEAIQNPAWMWFRIRRTQNSGTPANDDWQGTAWYGSIDDEPASIDGSAIDVVTRQRGVLALGWGCVNFMSLNEQRIAYLSFSGDPDTVPPPPPFVAIPPEAFPRGVLPERVSALATPGAVKRRTNAGLTQIRSITAIGWTWEETFGLLRVSDEDQMAVMTFIKRAWHSGESFLVKHLMSPGSGRTPNGLGTANVMIKGASQIGNVVLTDGWPTGTSNVVVAGDVVSIAGEVAVYMITANADSDGAGEASLELNPPLRSSPADDAIVTTADVEFLMAILSRSRFETTGAPTAYGGYQVRLIESLL